MNDDAPEISQAILNDFDRAELNRTSRKQTWSHLIAPYRSADTRRSVLQLLGTLAGIVVCEVAARLLVGTAPWATALFVILAAGFMVRAFIIFHDCCHGSYFNSQRANDIGGIWTGVLTLTPYHAWRKSHCIHHATTGDLDRRGTGDVMTMTVDEYRKATPLQRVAYRVYRNPLVLMVLGVLILFFAMNRIPGVHVKKPDTLNAYERLNVHLTTLGGLAIFASIWAVGGWASVIIHFLAAFAAGVGGIFLFYVQHQYPGVYWRRHANWEYLKASIAGSSWLQLPQPLRFFSGDIGVHHIHHLAPKVPNYKLDACARAVTLVGEEVKILTLGDALRTIRLKLWDEQGQKLIGWREFAALTPSLATGPAPSSTVAADAASAAAE